MPLVKWDEPGDKVYESGLDRGVLYLPDGSAVPWNGLTMVSEKFDKSTEPVFFDGAKIVDIVTLGQFSASLSAMTYPKRLDELEGSIELRSGVYLGEQPGGTFGICYRTRVGNDIDGAEAGYKIHVVYNITAVPSDREYKTTSDSTDVTEFQWDLIATPEFIEGYRPSSHLIIKTEELDPWLLRDIEQILYGSSVAQASLIPMDELVSLLNNWFRIRITDNGNGTWEAYTPYPEFFTLYPNDSFLITSANAIFIDDDTYIITDTKDVNDLSEVAIVDNHDGTYTASSSNPNTFAVDGDKFILRNASVEIIDVNTFVLSDTI